MINENEIPCIEWRVDGTIWRNFYLPVDIVFFLQFERENRTTLTEKPGQKTKKSTPERERERDVHRNNEISNEEKSERYFFLYVFFWFSYKTFSCFLMLQDHLIDDKLLYLSKHGVHRRCYRHA